MFDEARQDLDRSNFEDTISDRDEEDEENRNAND